MAIETGTFLNSNEVPFVVVTADDGTIKDDPDATRQSATSIVSVSQVNPELSVAVIVTGSDLTGEIRDMLKPLHRSLHIDLVDRKPIGNNSMDLYGDSGILRARLDLIEHYLHQDGSNLEEQIYSSDKSGDPIRNLAMIYGHDKLNQWLKLWEENDSESRQVRTIRELEWHDTWNIDILKQMNSQFQTFHEKFGDYPEAVSYHFGEHFDPNVIDLYHLYTEWSTDVCGIPSRYYNGHKGSFEPRSLHPHRLVDGLNKPDLQRSDIISAVGVSPAGKVTEICIHPGELGREDQALLFSNLIVRKDISKGARIVPWGTAARVIFESRRLRPQILQ